MCWFGECDTSAFTTTDANTSFTAYNSAFLVGGYYNGWWTGAEEIEMAEDACENSPTSARQTIVSNACVQFIKNHGSTWTSGSGFDAYNDDISWAVIALARGYLLTGGTNFLGVAKSNWDAMYFRAWDTNYLGGGLWWSTANLYKNAAVHGPAAIGACLLYNIYGDSSYLTKAEGIYAWERRVLVNTNNGLIADGINYPSTTTSGGATTYNQGTFIGAANLLYRATGLPLYYQDAVLVGKYTQTSMSSAAGILPAYSSDSDLSGFNGIFIRWMGKFAKDQNLWPAFGPWLTTNANAAWSLRNTTNNLAWQNWTTPTGTNTSDSWGCSASVVVMQVADASPADALQITPSNTFTVVAQPGYLPAATSVSLVLTNTSASAINWSLTSTSAWLSVSQTAGSLAASTSANVLASLWTSVATNLSAGRYYGNLWLTNTTSGLTQRRIFELVIASNAPLALTGYNANVVAPSTSTAAAPGASAFDIPNNFCWYQAGLNGSTRGLPPDSAFTSAADGASVFQFGYGVSNVLMLGYTYPSSATLTLTTPQSLNAITLLAASANTAGTVGSCVLNFTNGTQSQVFNYNAPDWFASATNAALQGVGRLKLASTFGAEDDGPTSPKLFQTTINLAALGINQPVASITFTKPSGAAGTQTTGIFAISGAVMSAAPTISVQPQSVANTQPAQGATFSAVATGVAPLSYQWFYSTNGAPGTYAPLPGQANTNLVLNPTLDPTNAGCFVIVATNGYGAVTSSVATLSVYRAPEIVQQLTPTNIFVFAGTSNLFSLIANAAVPATYFWCLNGNVLPGPNSSNYLQTHLQITNSGNYSVIVSNAFGAVTSSLATLTVAPFPTYPLGQAIVADHPLGYWRLDETSGPVAHDYLFNQSGTYTPKVLLAQPGNDLIDTHLAARFGLLAASNSCVTNIPIDFATTGNGTFSVEAWVNGGAQTTDAGLITKGYGSGGEQFNLDCGGTSHGFRFFVRDHLGNVYAASSGVTPNNQWQHVVGVCDALHGGVYLYVNGTNAASGTMFTNVGILSSSLAVSLGARQSGANTADDFQFVGSLEEVAIYNYALSAARIQAHFAAATNRPPVFVSNPFSVTGVRAGQPYVGSLSPQASDPNGDPITFAKVSGPAWLNLSGAGGLSGTPLSSDVGTNSFVVSARDPAGLSNSATMNLDVSAAPAIVTTLALQGNNLQLNWSGGIAPYQLQQATNLSNPDWQNMGAPMNAASLQVLATNPAAYFRLLGQ